MNLYAINPETQCCKWVAIDADYETEQAKRDLAKLRKELLLENVSRRPGIFPARRASVDLLRRSVASQAVPPFRLQSRSSARRAHQAAGFAEEGIEIFPKQDSLAPGALGNGIRAPWGIHRKNDNRYWFVDIGPLTLPAQIDALCALPKLSAEQLNDLTHHMPPPPQWEMDDPPLA